MAKVIFICGKICSGKTCYALNMMKHHSAVLLSSDELISALFHPHENEYHDKIVKNTQDYLLQKSTDILKAGVDVILDWGFWTRKHRESISRFYADRDTQKEWHYLDISDAEWRRNIKNRNADIWKKKTRDYYVDQGLIDKMTRLFEIPRRDEMDIWLHV